MKRNIPPSTRPIAISIAPSAAAASFTSAPFSVLLACSSASLVGAPSGKRSLISLEIGSLPVSIEAISFSFAAMSSAARSASDISVKSVPFLKNSLSRIYSSLPRSESASSLSLSASLLASLASSISFSDTFGCTFVISISYGRISKDGATSRNSVKLTSFPFSYLSSNLYVGFEAKS